MAPKTLKEIQKTGEPALRTLKFPILPGSINGDSDDQETDVNSLPDGLIGEILTRVPTKTVLTCKSVSNLWQSIITGSSSFPKTHLSRSTLCPLLVFTDVMSHGPSKILHMVEGQTLSDLENPKLNTRVEFPDVIKCARSFLRLLNVNAVSCEGLVCWATNQGSGDVVISNPATHEYATFNFCSNPPFHGYMAVVFIGLGYSQATGMFELLRMVLGKADDSATAKNKWWPEVCTVGTRLWRRIEDDNFPPMDFAREVHELVYVKGAIYWRYLNETMVCFYDFDKQTLHVVSFPEFYGLEQEYSAFAGERARMGVLGDFASISLASPLDGHIEIWVLKYINNSPQRSWAMIHYIDTLTTRFENSGSLWANGIYKTIMYLEDGKILMHDWHDTFLLYDPMTGFECTIRLVEQPVRESLREDFLLQVMPHLPRIMSLEETLNIRDGSLKVLRSRPRRSTRSRAFKAAGVLINPGRRLPHA